MRDMGVKSNTVLEIFTVTFIAAIATILLLTMRGQSDRVRDTALSMVGKDLSQVKRTFTPLRKLSDAEYEDWSKASRLRDPLPKRLGSSTYLHHSGVDVVFFFFEDGKCVEVFYTQT